MPGALSQQASEMRMALEWYRHCPSSFIPIKHQNAIILHTMLHTSDVLITVRLHEPGHS